MTSLKSEGLKIFLSYASNDFEKVKKRYRLLKQYGYNVWFDKVDILPGQNWDSEIKKAIKETDLIIVFLSKNSVSKEGYIQKEILMALDKASEKLENSIFLIPARLDECNVPSRLENYQYVNLYAKDGFNRLLAALNHRENFLGKNMDKIHSQVERNQHAVSLVREHKKNIRIEKVKNSIRQLPSSQLAVMHSMLMPGERIPAWSIKLLKGIFASLDEDENALEIVQKVAIEFNMYDVLDSLSELDEARMKRRTL